MLSQPVQLSHGNWNLFSISTVTSKTIKYSDGRAVSPYHDMAVCGLKHVSKSVDWLTKNDLDRFATSSTIQRSVQLV